MKKGNLRCKNIIVQIGGNMNNLVRKREQKFDANPQ